MRVSLAGLELEAHSVGGVETCFQIPAYDVCLDIGRCPPGAERRSTLLLSHAHIDHAAGLPYYVSMRGLNGMKPPRVYCPAASHGALAQLLQVWTGLQSDAGRCELIAVKSGDRIPLGRDRYARVFASPHRIATVGYTLFRTVRKLRAELEGTPGEEIARLARSGASVHEVVERPELCFPGDTRIEVLDQEPTVTRARALILECTFMGSEVTPAIARAGGHVHLDQIAEYADRFENEAVLLTHFSRRHDRHEIERAVQAALPESLRRRVQLLIHSRESDRSPR